MRNKLKFEKISKKEGFTIIELLIAMAGFSFVLLLVTVVMINIGNLYSKGINQTRIDDASRTVLDDISTKIKYSKASSYSTAGGTLANGTTYLVYCINNSKFAVSSSISGTNFLRRSTLGTGAVGCPVDTANDSTSGTDLLPQNSKLAYFNITKNGSNFTINISMVYGNFSNTNISNFSAPPNGIADNFDKIQCNTGTSYQYCAVTNLSTVVSSRLN